jgi:hypothetical protein
LRDGDSSLGFLRNVDSCIDLQFHGYIQRYRHKRDLQSSCSAVVYLGRGKPMVRGLLVLCSWAWIVPSNFHILGRKKPNSEMFTPERRLVFASRFSYIFLYSSLAMSAMRLWVRSFVFIRQSSIHHWLIAFPVFFVSR